ncbi:MAG TPA: type IV secretion system protein, partial [Thermoanaerobaculia bacterium]|nr:type IV secretion system protein [Thermoanaerobaculia bacterium]
MTEGTLDAIVALFQGASLPLFARVYAPMRTLFVVLWVIDFSWDAGVWLLSEVPDFWGRILRKLLVFFLIWGLLTIAPFWLWQVLDGFGDLGEELTGVAGLSPSAVLDQGVQLFFSMFTSWEQIASLFHPVGVFLRLFTAVTLLLAFTLIAAALLRVLVEAALALGGLPFFLGFAGHSLTWGLAEGYLRYLLNLGARIFVLYLLVGVGSNLAEIWADAIRNASAFSLFSDPRLFVAIPMTAAIWAGLVLSLPGAIAREITGP